MNNILLYNSRGTDNFCVSKTEESFRAYLGNRDFKLISVDASYFTSNNLQDAQAIVIPGGNAGSIACNIGPTTREAIKNFVLQGGSYMGFCAGAYFAGEFTYQNRKKINFGLNLTSCKLSGPFIDLGEGANSLNADSARAVLVEDRATKAFFHTFWNGGGSYDWYPTGNTFSMALYNEYTYATICSYASKGCVILSNIHPEIQLSQSEVDDHFPLMDNKDKLVSSLPQQKALFGRMCDLAGLGEKENSSFRMYVS